MPVLFLEIFGFLISILGARGRIFLSWVLAILAFDILRIRRKLVMRNLSRAFGADCKESVRAKVGRASVANFILTTLEFFCARSIFNKQEISFKNEDVMKSALEKQQGVYAMVIHSGNFEMMAFGVSRRFCKIHAPVKPVGKGQMAEWVRKMRESHGLIEITNSGKANKSRTARIFDGLKKNEMVGFMVDQRRTRGLLLSFFGEPAWTNSGLFYLWKQHQAPIVPVTIRRCGLNRHEIEFHDELIVLNEEQWSFEQFVLENTKKMNQYVETLVSANPAEYFWMHDRWKK
ncbi:MAG: hypothetical protein EBR09_11300 [Proteobacteria bacterium]|nr:hypothetical protein [Pseudomonadota bacterium]